jgi:AhpD family alkylhydroperoxidase
MEPEETGFHPPLHNSSRELTRFHGESMPGFQSPSDYEHIKDFHEGAPTEAHAFLSFKSAAERVDGVIPLKVRELISVGVALSLQCAYCISVHTRNAKAAGATLEEMAEVVFITSAVNAGAVVGHGLMAMRMYSEAAATTTSLAKD